MTEAKIAFQSGTNPSNTTTVWNTLSSNSADVDLTDLLDVTGASTGWDYQRLEK